ncbi:MAG TPA: AAA family ATPase [Rhodocyclaceae bacterium]|nr:AAA family ATPase [Rhodocyclaceae bacterium]HRQ47077.1 AAA family ATPase [Rhodocyclaceae bacterium]
MENAGGLARNLMRPDAFSHPADDLECIETHISWVILAGEYAYKLKKPLDLGFLDFSTLALRRAACEEELRLNRRTAPELYLEVVAICGSEACPQIGGDGPVVDHAVRMRRFDQSLLFGNLLARDALTVELIDRLAAHVADFHAIAAVAGPADGFGTPAAVGVPVRQNFEQIRERIDSPELLARLEEIASWSETEGERLAVEFGTRLADGKVRECHGDLHLGNLTLVGDEPRLFDAIEFNPSLRWTDVIADVAFLVMDLRAHSRADLASRFLNAYLERSGDYAGLSVLRYYLVYRAMVRAKIAAIRLGQLDGTAREDALDEFRRYLDLAAACALPAHGYVLIACGLSGSGKTTASMRLVAWRGVIRLRSDVERKRLFGMPADARSRSSPGGGIYSEDAGVRTYAQLAALTARVVAEGYPVLVDATFLYEAQRRRFRELATERGVPCVVLHFDAPLDVLRERVARRAALATDASEADVAVLESQLARFEPPGRDAAESVLRVPTDGGPDWDALLPELDRMTGAAGRDPAKCAPDGS